MKGLALLFAVLFCCSGIASQDHPIRPKILGIAAVHVYSTNIAAARDFYSKVVSPMGPCLWCEEAPRSPLMILLNGEQILFVPRVPEVQASSFLAEIDFATEDIAAMKRFLIDNKVAFSAPRGTNDGPITLNDPEGHSVAFVRNWKASPKSALNVSTSRLIHAGFVVKDLVAENRFYVDLLGFLYWHGGFKDDGEDWYELQVPDGSDWIEYMLNIPADADRKELGIQNHFSLGVKDIHATAEQLRKNGIDKFDGPEISRDGKWVLDVYDPDGTRVEFMEFTPAREPCCHPYTAAHPKP